MPTVVTLSVIATIERPPILRYFIITAIIDGKLVRCLVDNAYTSNYVYER